MTMTMTITTMTTIRSIDKAAGVGGGIFLFRGKDELRSRPATTCMINKFSHEPFGPGAHIFMSFDRYSTAVIHGYLLMLIFSSSRRLLAVIVDDATAYFRCATHITWDGAVGSGAMAGNW